MALQRLTPALTVLLWGLCVTVSAADEMWLYPGAISGSQSTLGTTGSGRMDSALFRSLGGPSKGGQQWLTFRAQGADGPDPSSTGERGLSTASVDVGAPHELGTPSIEEPGPDSADFPDSAFTVKPGVVYFETSLTTESSAGIHDYFTNTLIRIGVRENWELRISSPGVIQEVGPGVDTTGFGPLTFGFKRHVWDEEGSLPAFGIIAQVKTPTASAGFDNGAAEPTVFFNFDKSLPGEFDFEWNAGLTWLKGEDGDRFLQGNILWALGHQLAPHIEGFTHGFANFPAEDGSAAEVVVGPGVAWIVSQRAMLDFSYNFGLTDQSPHRLIRFGLSLAF